MGRRTEHRSTFYRGEEGVGVGLQGAHSLLVAGEEGDLGLRLIEDEGELVEEVSGLEEGASLHHFRHKFI